MVCGSTKDISGGGGEVSTTHSRQSDSRIPGALNSVILVCD